MANFRTDGKITMQSALSRTLCGILSGAFRISCSTFPAFSTRSDSLSWAETGSASTETNPRLSNSFLMNFPLPPCSLAPFLGCHIRKEDVTVKNANLLQRTRIAKATGKTLDEHHLPQPDLARN